MRIFRFLMLMFLVAGCACGSSRSILRIGIDTKWYPLDFGSQTSYVNGYIEDLLLEMHQYSGMKFELVNMNWDSTLEGLKEKKYDAMFTSMTPLASNSKKYDFSEKVLSLGPLLIVGITSEKTSLDEMENEAVGVLMGSKEALIIEKFPTILIRTYETISDLLNAVALNDIEGALLPKIPAINYVKDLYSTSLKIVGKPLDESGIRLMGPLGSVHQFNKMFKSLKKRKVVHSIQEKWGLATSENLF